MVAAGLFFAVAVLLSRVAPVLLMPLFYRSARSNATRCASAC